MKDSSSSGPRKGRSRNYNNKNRNNNRRHIKQKVPRRAKKKSILKRILELFGIGKTKPKKKPSKKNPRNRKTPQNSRNSRKKPIRANKSQRTPEKTPVTSGRLYVGNLPYKTTDEELKELFNQAGEVISAEVVRHRRNNRSKGYAFVEMANVEIAQKAATQMHEYSYLERRLIVNGAKSAGREDN
jgi:RNA recognition motif-containing protein